MINKKFEVNGVEIDVEIRKNEKGIYEYYMQSAEPGIYILIGGYDPKIMDDKIIFKENTIENEALSQIKDQLNAMSDEEIEKQAELTKMNDELERYAEKNGIELERAIVIDKSYVEESLENDEKERKEDKPEEQIEKEESKEEEITTTRQVTVKDEFELSEPVDGIRSLKNTLGNIPSEYTKIGMIESDKMDEMKDKDGNSYKNNSARFDLVVINEKTHEIRPLREFVNIEQSRTYGDAPRSEEDSFLANNDGTANQNEKDDIQGKSIYQLGDIIIELGQRDHGDEVAYFAKRAHGERNFAGHELRGKNNVTESNRDERDANGEFGAGQYAVNKSIDEGNKEKIVHGKEITDESQIDGQEKPVEEGHSDLKNIDNQLIEKMKNEIKDREDVEEAYSDREIEEMLKQKIKEKLQENSEMKFEELKKDVYDEIEKEAEEEHIHRHEPPKQEGGI